MIFGVTLFFGLARAVLVPNKVRFRCPKCALLRHDPDAVHCKACGEVLNIPDDGLGNSKLQSMSADMPFCTANVRFPALLKKTAL